MSFGEMVALALVIVGVWMLRWVFVAVIVTAATLALAAVGGAVLAVLAAVAWLLEKASKPSVRREMRDE